MIRQSDEKLSLLVFISSLIISLIYINFFSIEYSTVFLVSIINFLFLILIIIKKLLLNGYTLIVSIFYILSYFSQFLFKDHFLWLYSDTVDGYWVYSEIIYDSFDEFIAIDSLKIALTGFLLFIFAIVTCQKFAASTVKQAFRPMIQGNALFLGWFLFFAHIFHFNGWLGPVSGVAGQFLEPAGPIAAILLIASLDKKPAIGKIIILAALGVLAYLYVSESYLSKILVVIIGTFIILLAQKHYKALACLGLLGSFVILSYPAVRDYRTITWLVTPNLSTVGKMGLLAETLWAHWSTGAKTSTTQTQNRPLRRLSHAHILSYVVQKTPNSVPYWNGATYLPLLTSSIPRILYPDKPEERLGYHFGQAYDFDVEESITSFNVPWMIEMYMNFGQWGVYIGMALLGVFVWVLNKIFIVNATDDVNRAIGVGILAPLVIQESNFSLMVGTLPLFVLCLWIYFRAGGYMLSWVSTRLGQA